MEILIILLAAALAALLGTAIHHCIFCPRKEKAKEGKRRILCIGDSITYGTGVLYSRWKNAFPVMLEEMLGKEFQVLNYGISGATLLDEGDSPYRKSFLKAARNTNPEVCILMLGTNDSKPQNWNAEKYEETLERWINALKSFSSNPSVYVMTPPAAFRVNGKPVVYRIRDDVIREEIYPIVKRQAERCRTGLVDLYAATETHPELFGDGVHPNKQGNHLIAQQIYNALKKDIGL